MNEADTNVEHFDPALKAAGWGVVEGSRVLREYPITLGRIEGCGWARISEPQAGCAGRVEEVAAAPAFSRQL
jgi:hypothetical protein